ncbi:MAG TPA: MFS transporter [Micropepsaceae bacterium]|nr:MFS transporter [Micropepsaceae bacterium]
MQKEAPAAAPPKRSLLRRMFTPVAQGQPGDGPTSPKDRRKAFQILFFSLVCMGVGQSLMFAILPPVSRQLGLSETEVGAIFAISATIWVFTSGFWGHRSDHWGRRPLIIMGLMAFAISTALFATVVQLGLLGIIAGFWVIYPLLVASRSIYGIFGSGAHPAAQGYIADRTSPSERTEAVSTLSAAFGLGTTVGPGIGAALVVFGFVAPLYFVAFIAACSAFAIWRFLPERTRPSERERPKRLSVFDRRVFPFIIANVLLGTAGAIPIQTVSFLFMDVLQLDTDNAIQFTGVGLMASSVAALFAQLVLVQRFRLTSDFLLRWGVIVAFASSVLFVVGNTFGLLVAALVLSGLGFGLARPGISAAASLSVGHDQQGAVAGLTGAAGAAGFIFAPLIGNPLYETMGPHAPYVLSAILILVLAIFIVLTPRLRTAHAKPSSDVETSVPES